MVGAVVPSFDYALYARTTSAMQRRPRRARLFARAGRAPLRSGHRASRHRAARAATASMRSCSSGWTTTRPLRVARETTGGPTCSLGASTRCDAASVDRLRQPRGDARDDAATCSSSATARFGLLSAPTKATTARASAAQACARRWPSTGLRSTTACVQYGPSRWRPRGSDGAAARGSGAADRRRRDERRVRGGRDDRVPRGGRAHSRGLVDHRRRQHRSRRDADARA